MCKCGGGGEIGICVRGCWFYGTAGVPLWESTAIFIRTLLRFWNKVNVKTSTKDIRKRLDDAKVISSCEDKRLIWLTNFSCWLKLWRSHNEKVKSGHLTKESFTALSQTVVTLVMLVKELLQVHKLRM